MKDKGKLSIKIEQSVMGKLDCGLQHLCKIKQCSSVAVWERTCVFFGNNEYNRTGKILNNRTNIKKNLT